MVHPTANAPVGVLTEPVDSAAGGVPTVPRSYLAPFVLLTSLFALWGLANNMTDVLLATFRRIMSMTDFQTSWIQVAFYGSYFCLALPAALFVRRFSYKNDSGGGAPRVRRLPTGGRGCGAHSSPAVFRGASRSSWR